MTGFSIALTDPFHADALELINLSEREQAALYPPEHRFAMSAKELVQAAVRFYVARQDHLSIGCGGFAPMDGYGELKRVYVRKDMRGTGVARRLIERCEAQASHEGLDVMRLETGVASQAALSLYERMGYVRTGPFGAYPENGSSIFMEKVISHD